MAESSSFAVVGLTAVVGAFILLFVFLCNLIRSHSKKETEQTQAYDEKPQNGGSLQEIQGRKKEKPTLVKKRDSRLTFAHPWLTCTLRSHNGHVLGIDFSPNGKYLATCSQDRTILVWNVKEFNKKEHKSMRANVELDHATKVRFSPDSRAFIVSLFSGETVRVFKMGKKDDNLTGKIQAAFDFSQRQSVEIINIGIASNGKFIMTCHRDTTVKIWDIKGELLHTIDTHQMNNSHGIVSPCGRFVATAGFTPDVKVWEVCFDKSGSFKEVVRAFELKGHSSGVYSFSFSNDSRRMATVSKDGTWKLWDTNVEYQKKQDPYLLKSWRFEYPGPSLIALSPDARTVALATGTTIRFYSVLSSDCEQTIEDVHADSITALEFSICSAYLVSAGDKHINVFYNVIGYKGTIKELEEKKKQATSQALKERLQEQIEEAQILLKSVEEKS